MHSVAPPAPAPASTPLHKSAWRARGVVFGAMLGLFAGFNGLFFAALPFFMKPIAAEFGWGRGQVSAAAVLSMLGVTLASPMVGRLIDRFGAVRTIGTSVVLLSACLLALGALPPHWPVLAGLSLAVGLAGAATTMAGYLSVLPRWFDRRLGLALGLAGVGLGLGVIVNGWVATALITAFGWRTAFAAMAAIALLLGLVALGLVGQPPEPADERGPVDGRAGQGPRQGVVSGCTLRQALVTARFWLLAVSALLVPMGILGSAVHAPALYSDRGLSLAQAALGASLAGIGAMGARVAVGVLLDRFFAPWVAMAVFLMGAAGLWASSVATSLPGLLAGSLLAGMAIGAEGDLLPYLVRRYMGQLAFGAIFGCLFAAYALGGVLGPALYGVAFDRLGGYATVMQWAAAACVFSALLMLGMGPYRHAAAAATPR